MIGYWGCTSEQRGSVDIVGRIGGKGLLICAESEGDGIRKDRSDLLVMGHRALIYRL